MLGLPERGRGALMLKPTKATHHLRNPAIWLIMCSVFMCSVFIALFSATAHAGAWPQPAGTTSLITKLTATGAPQAFDLTGKLRAGAGFKKTELEIYAEHGLRESITLVGKANVQDTIAGAQRQSGLATWELGARARVWTFDDLSLLSVQASVLLPGREHDKTTPLLTSGHADYDLRLLRGTPGTFFDIPGFNDIQLAYRHRGGGPADELRLDVTYGFDLTEKWLVMLQSQTVTSIGNSRAPFTSYRSQKLQASLRWQFDESHHVEIGGLRTIAGAQTVRETGAFVALWSTF